ncbi:MAG: acetate/propionate family kinase [Methylobacteriaceae bacterium]|nr:acetate/propionate family kinase [Methylobacteriaceae bacterium]MBV9705516.1 acetate/propionate family kinase [Methylobacteriaceae bacterium]
MTSALLVINAGSSSIKCAIHQAGTLEPLLRGTIDAIGKNARFRAAGSLSDKFAGASPPANGNHEEVTAWLIEAIRQLPGLQVAGAGHRVVHGGLRFDRPVLVTDEIVAALGLLTPLAPGHQPHNLAAIAAVAEHWPGLPQVACFDTAFHRTQPRLAQLFALPRSYADEGILRYGFHGLSYEYVAGVLPEIAGPKADGRVIVAHLGHGASLCAMRGRRSIATTMALTALDGLMMGTRCGNIDPGLILHLIRERGMSVQAVEDLLDYRSGLLGVSGISDDLRALEASEDPAAREALDLFAYRCSREAGSLMAALGGLDGLVFTAGIGENSASMRSAICEGLAWTGLRIDNEQNNRNATRITGNNSAMDVFVVPTNEELVIARALVELLDLG